MTTLLNTQLQQVINELNQFATSDLIEIYNECADQNSYERIYDNDELTLDDMFTSHYDAIRASFYGDYNPIHTYFTFNGYGNLQSFEYLDSEHSPIDLEELAQWLINEDKLSDYDIQVTTLDDIYNNVLDHINDIDSVSSIQCLLSYLAVDFLYTKEWLELSKNNTIDNYIERYIDIIIADFIDSDDIDQLEGLLDYFNHK